MSPDHINNIYNFLRGDSRAVEIDPSGNNMQTNNVSTIEERRYVGDKATEEVLQIRKKFKNYFSTTGAVDWQTDIVRRSYKNQQRI